MSNSSIDTPLTRNFPSTRDLSRQDLEALVRASSQTHPQSQQSQSQSQESQTIEAQHDSAFFEAFFDSLPQVRELFTSHEELLRANETLAARNQALQAPLENLRREVMMEYERSIELEKEWASLEVKTREEEKRFSPESLLALLSHKNSKLHEQSESLANAFVEGLPFEVAESHPPSLSPSPNNSSPSPTPFQSSNQSTSSVQSPSTNHTSLSSSNANSNPQDPSLTFVRRYRAMRTNYHKRNLIGERMANGTVTWRE